ncbi:unnamed protein product [Adineta ricciae]|uniref:PCI domain-containing protein n=1 Tax=Adineta ricciae TaxID=249248 RepID=A0A813U7U1_ADIRI|nr:unnamed protein product [Adineta ricciae]CAF0932956.1 unnamed protein product [Adineta ricciae]
MFRNRFFAGENSSTSEDSDDDAPQNDVQESNAFANQYASGIGSSNERNRSKKDQKKSSGNPSIEQFLVKSMTIKEEAIVPIKKSLKKHEVPDDQKVNDEPKAEEVNVEFVLKKLNEILFKRGKSIMNYQDEFQNLEQLRELVIKQNLDSDILIEISMAEITFGLDSQRQRNESSGTDVWKCTLDRIDELLNHLFENNKSNGDILMPIMIQMDDTYTQILRDANVGTQEYRERFMDEQRISSILDRFQTYLELNNENHSENRCVIYFRIVKHIYYKYDKSSEQSTILSIDQLCKFIKTHDETKFYSNQAILCQIYHLALHDHYHQAHDLMLMSRLQDTIDSLDISIQILYNRTMIQLGLAAFRCGQIPEAHKILADFQCGRRLRELLGQDNNHQIYLYPYHMHINLQLIECVYCVSAMLIEAASTERHRVSKHFYKLMSQTVWGPPESMREHIVAACHALKVGDWKCCIDLIVNEKMNRQVWKSILQNTDVYSMLRDRIKEVSLQCYLRTCATAFNDISMSILADMFDISVEKVSCIVGKLIFCRELMGSIDEETKMITLDEKTQSKAEKLSLELLGKVLKLHDQNEKLTRILQ